MKPRTCEKQSQEIIDIFDDVVKRLSNEVEVVFTDYKGVESLPVHTSVNYIFGSAEYFKDTLDESLKVGNALQLPAIVLFCPFREDRTDPEYFTKAKVNLLIVTGTQKSWSNKQRKIYSFENVLRPIYRKLLDTLANDKRLDFGYRGKVEHEYSENYSYGKYGAYVDHSGEMVSEPIDAIDIRNLYIKVRTFKCR